MKIVVDLDGVVCDFNAAAIAEFGPCNEALFSLEERWPGKGKRLKEFVDNPSVYANLRPIPGAQEALVSLRMKGHYIIACTSRPPQTKYATEFWLATRWMQVDDLYVVGWKEKASFVMSLDPGVVIDDAPAHILPMQELGLLTIAYDQPWNRELTGYRVTNWKAFECVVDGLAMTINRWD